jgi:hypothetical protein
MSRSAAYRFSRWRCVPPTYASLRGPTDLADRVADDLYTQRLSIGAAAKALPIGNRAELRRWRGEVRKVLSQLLGPTPERTADPLAAIAALG